jgi:hypothetical protein
MEPYKDMTIGTGPDLSRSPINFPLAWQCTTCAPGMPTYQTAVNLLANNEPTMFTTAEASTPKAFG